MSANSSIEWCEKTWNPVRGCSVISPGCVNCYAMKQAHRFSRPGRAYEGLTKLTKAGPQWTGVVRTIESALLEPLSWRKPARVFVNSMGDLFHELVPFDFVDRVFAVMALAPRHTFQILTKRPARMLEFTKWLAGGDDISIAMWPRNVWLGVSVEDQQRADERIPLLLQTPAAVRFISAEPLLGPLDLTELPSRYDRENRPLLRLDALRGGHRCGPARFGPDTERLDWVIVGGESGPDARPCAIEWIESIVAQCRAVAVPIFVKQLGAYVVSEERTAPAELMSNPAEALRRFRAPNGECWAWRLGLKHRKGGDTSEWPVELRVREFPEVRA